MTNAERQREYRKRQKANKKFRPTKAQIAEAGGISRVSLWRTKIVAKYAPELFDKLKTGEISISTGFKIANARRIQERTLLSMAGI